MAPQTTRLERYLGAAREIFRREGEPVIVDVLAVVKRSAGDASDTANQIDHQRIGERVVWRCSFVTAVARGDDWCDHGAIGQLESASSRSEYFNAEPVGYRQAGQRQGSAAGIGKCELVPVHVSWVVDRKPGQNHSLLNHAASRDGNNRRRKIECEIHHIVANRPFGLVDEHRVPRLDFDAVVPGASVYPHCALHSRPDGDVVVAVHGINDDRQEVAFVRQQSAVEHQFVKQKLALVRVGGREHLQIDDQLRGIPNQIVVLIGGVEVEPYLQVE